ncbi:hypothetical protein O181_061634 [Austropuccinia psidii MF-1]|uniref:Uncharacterized protein n=1 Tax=Austropuccinia psidii MF-1 TaxID=1389203 RepID=A0A9Q3I0R8_9BASI|nr:hypothetical protein [Austropuccinia psidii MF-1]
MYQIYILHISYVIHKGCNDSRKLKLLEESATRIREKKANIQAIEEQLNQTEYTLIPSGSRGLAQPNSQVASHHSGNSRSVAKSHHSSQSQVAYRRL